MATTKVGTSTMKAAQITKPGAGFQIDERKIPEPRAGQVRIKVQACGVCHSDVFTVDSRLIPLKSPRHNSSAEIGRFKAGLRELQPIPRTPCASPN